MTDAAYDAGDLLVKAAAFMAAARARRPPPRENTNHTWRQEINLAVERIAAEFKTVRSEISSGSNYADRINALETAVTELTQNQAQIANALAKLGGQTQPF